MVTCSGDHLGCHIPGKGPSGCAVGGEELDAGEVAFCAGREERGGTRLICGVYNCIFIQQDLHCTIMAFRSSDIERRDGAPILEGSFS